MPDNHGGGSSARQAGKLTREIAEIAFFSVARGEAKRTAAAIHPPIAAARPFNPGRTGSKART
ncbi:hypothetical protein CV103_09510 [Sphingomonas fennica]|uniref:Uncharacterized protein n=1 Tax=Edaphosphingomonas fennica TaxID=114404 RepID=A0A2T4HZT5_9SPHN|nr:hypothetical protein [Sphingomonas sp.]PTD22010.1 hypothetical protein CV103_09510 [Sphingomonas fennica]